jgi:hypothetical protein
VKQYLGPGLIKQVPATKRYFVKKGDPVYGRVHKFMKGNIYRGVNENGGRKIPQNTIGAAYRHTNANGPTWERGLEGINDVSVRLSIADNRITLSPEIDSGA